LVIILLSGLFRDGITIVVFKLNQNYIARNLCVNRDKPMTMCGGSCYLKKKLEKNRQEDQPYPRSQTKEDRLLEFYSCAASLAGPAHSGQDNTPFLPYHDKLFCIDFITGIFHPPKI
jgi:hypothetical protein